MMIPRREFLKSILALGAGLMLAPLQAIAAFWNKPAFEAIDTLTALQALNIKAETNAADITIIAPDRAENGAIVQVEIKSKLANTEAIAILVEKNPTPLIANFTLSNGTLPHIITRIKMAESAEIITIVKAGNQYYRASKHVDVTEGGCG